MLGHLRLYLVVQDANVARKIVDWAYLRIGCEWVLRVVRVNFLALPVVWGSLTAVGCALESHLLPCAVRRFKSIEEAFGSAELQVHLVLEEGSIRLARRRSLNLLQISRT